MRAVIGDSLMFNGLGPVLADYYGWEANITARGGNTVADQSPDTFMFNPAQGDIYPLWLGTNDKNLGGGITNRETTTQLGHLALVLHLATKEGANKVRAQSMTAAGTWANMTSTTDPKGRSSTTNGSTLTCSVTGTSVAVVGYWNNSQAGQFSVTIDGVSKGTFNATPPGALVPSNIGLTSGPFAQTFTGLSNTTHTVVITVVSATSASNVVYIGFVAGYGSVVNIADPLVVVANTHDYTAAANTANGTTTAQNTRYKTLIAANVTTAQSFGLNVYLVDADALIGNSALLGPDGLHPLQSGYLVMRQAFVSASPR
jgi:hypothetical protein